MKYNVYVQAIVKSQNACEVYKYSIQFLLFSPTSDQMNPLQNLTGVSGVGGPGTIGMSPRAPVATMGAMGTMNQMPIGQHTMQGVSGNQQGGPFSIQIH